MMIVFAVFNLCISSSAFNNGVVKANGSQTFVALFLGLRGMCNFRNLTSKHGLPVDATLGTKKCQLIAS